MKRTHALLSALVLLFAGCGRNESSVPKETAVPSPPSIATEKTPGTIGIVALSAEEASALGVATVTAAPRRFDYTLDVPGLVFAAPENLYIVSAPVDGRVAEIHAHEGAPVHKGQLLAELESLTFSTLVAEYLQARAEDRYQTKQLARIDDLVRKRVNPQNELEKAQADCDRARAALRAATAKLLALGIQRRDMDTWDTSSVVDPHLRIVSPIEGAISEHLIDRGQAVTALQKMLAIVNLGKVLIHGYVSPEDAGLVAVGDTVRIMTRMDAMRTMTARVTSINPTLDERSRSITIYIETPTRDRWPKPGDNVRLAIHARTPEPVIAIPSSAIAYEGAVPVVFVQKDERRYEKRAVSIGRSTGEGVILAGGVAGGERVAVSQVFSLKALSRIAQFAE